MKVDPLHAREKKVMEYLRSLLQGFTTSSTYSSRQKRAVREGSSSPSWRALFLSRHSGAGSGSGSEGRGDYTALEQSGDMARAKTIWQDIVQYRRTYLLTAVASFGGECTSKCKRLEICSMQRHACDKEAQNGREKVSHNSRKYANAVSFQVCSSAGTLD